MRKLIFLFFVLSLFLVNLVNADMIPAGQKYVKYSAEVENINAFPEYTFILFGDPLANGLIIKNGEEFHFYKYASPHIYAIKNENFDLKEFEKNREEYNLKTYLLNNPNFIESDLQLKNYGLVSEFDPLDKAKDVLKIKYLDENNFVVVRDQVIYTYNDNMVEIKESNSLNMDPSRTTIFPSWTISALVMIGLLLSLVALIVIIVLVVRKIRK